MEGPSSGDVVVQRIPTERELYEIRRWGSGAKPEGRFLSDATTLVDARSLACQAANGGRIWIEGVKGQFAAYECHPQGGPR